MHAYRFYLTPDNIEDFYFEIDILPSQTFRVFHDKILEVLQLSGTELASFYVSNNQWKKKTEITLIDMNIEDDSDLYDDEDDEMNKPKKKKILLMDKVKLSDIIDDPHQRFIYIYDFLSPWTVFVELMKIVEVDKPKLYPMCVKIDGELPVKKAIPKIETLDDEDENIVLGDDTEIHDEEEEDGFGNEFGADEDALGEGFDDLKF
ncbi:MAG: hypothetical protein PHT69_08300 [Bacteroidales bacterium]|nr:hypothetical protein [Bacteroidales bacterium]